MTPEEKQAILNAVVEAQKANTRVAELVGAIEVDVKPAGPMAPVFKNRTCLNLFGGCISDPLPRESRHTTVKAQIDAMADARVFNVVQVLCSPWELVNRRIE